MAPNARTEAGVWCRHCRGLRTWTCQTSHAAEGIVRLRRCRACRSVYRTLETYLSGKAGNVCEDYPAVAPRRAK